jgi:hypothetical protein
LDLTGSKKKRLYATLEVKDGLIIIMSNSDAEEPYKLFGITFEAQRGDLVNLLIEVHAGETLEVRHRTQDIPPCRRGPPGADVVRGDRINLTLGAAILDLSRRRERLYTVVGGDGFEPPTLSV